jgi:ribosome biogenesis GTPase
MKPDLNATVLYAARRKAIVLLQDFTQVSAKISNKLRDLTVGDQVNFKKEEGDYFITERLDPRNIFSRSLGAKSKEIANNVDRIFLVTAFGNLYQTQFNDRILVSAYLKGIPCSLIVNKVDLDHGVIEASIDNYRKLNYPVHCVSAKFAQGLEQITAYLDDPNLKHVCFIGLSGVGKSTLLNHFIPEAMRQTALVREKSGTGQQTTSQARGYLYKRTGSPLIITDPPGIQNFGITNIDKHQLREAFIEFNKYNQGCEFRDCTHISESNCAVKLAVADGRIDRKRFDSYLELYEEIQRYKKY